MLAFANPASGLKPARSLDVALIPSGAFHHLQAQGPMAFLYLDAMSADQKRLQAQEPLHLTAAQRAAIKLTGDSNAVDQIGRILNLWPYPLPPSDPRIVDLVRRIDQHPEDYPDLKTAAASIGLSPSRCQTLLSQHLGMPFRRYRLWRRMAQVMRAVAVGSNLTEAAHASGFNSSAHFSTSFRVMFGLTPSALFSLGVTVDYD